MTEQNRLWSRDFILIDLVTFMATTLITLIGLLLYVYYLYKEGTPTPNFADK